MLKNNSNLKGAQKLSKNDLKSISGGAGPLCPTFCFYDEQTGGFSCGPGMACMSYSCGRNSIGFRCEVVQIQP